MNENVKTAVFAGVAAVLCIGAVVASIRPAATAPQDVGNSLFADFKDPLDAKRMAIVTFDDKSHDFHTFEVKQVDGLWSLPSNGNYPADAKSQVADAANALIGVKVLGKVSSDPATHAEYGVVQPEPNKPDAPTKGVGKLIEIDNGADKPLAHLIVGKEDKQRSENGPGNLRFVRRPGNNDVFRVALNIDKFSTKFEDWIEKDLLKLKAFDVQQVELHDYSMDKKINQQGAFLQEDKRMTAKLAFNDKDSKWSLIELADYKKPKETAVEKDVKDEKDKAAPDKDAPSKDTPDAAAKEPVEKDGAPKKSADAVPASKTPAAKTPAEKTPAAKTPPAKKATSADDAANESDKNNQRADPADDPLAGENDPAKKPTVITKLPEGDELNDQKLNDLKSALADLKIVDVQRKPAGLSGSLKADKNTIDRTALESLQRHGFYIFDGEIYSDQGEVHCLMKDGVRYVLRFGEIAEDTAGGDDAKDDKKKDGKEGDDKKPKGANRYLFVKAEFDETAIPAPALIPLPEAPKAPATEKPEEPKDKTPAAPEGDKKADEKPADPKANDKNYQAPKKDEATDKGQPADKKADDKEPKVDETKSDAKPDAKSEAKDGNAKEAPKADDKAEAPAKPAKPELTPEQLADQLAQQKKFIETQNKRTQDEYDEKVKAGKRHAAELNARFADWYYVVPDEVFRKIHLSREDIIKKKGAPTPDDGGGPEAPSFKLPETLKPGVIPKSPHK